MNALRLFATCVLVTLFAAPSGVLARDRSKATPVASSDTRAAWRTSDAPLEMKTYFSGATIDTFVLGDYTFDGPLGDCDVQGWTAIDRTAQYGVFFHVDDFAGLGAGDYGRLTPLSGNQSLWCGVRGDSTSEMYCGFRQLPGYGNYWSQYFESTPIPVIGDAVLTYQIRWDTEPGYDFVYVECMDTSGAWVELASYDGIGESTDSWIVPAGPAPDSIRVRFRFESDLTFSDEDSLWTTDGAVIVDSLIISDSTGVVNFQDFETEVVGATTTTDGTWSAGITPGYGVYAGLFHGGNVLQEDPCVYNTSCLWGFFAGSTADYSCGGHPEQLAVPFQNDRGQFMRNEIWSPWIDWNHDVSGNPVPATASQAFFDFDVYTDLPLENVVFYIWYVRAKVDGCPTPWVGDNFLHHNTDDPHWRLGWSGRLQIARLVPPGATHIQVAIGVADMCEALCGVYGPGTCHSHAPLIDNVRVGRIDTPGPIWAPWDWTLKVYEPELFQDNFPEIAEYTRPGTGEITSAGKVRIDIGQDLFFSSTPNILPGDSLRIIVLEPTYGLAPDPSGGYAVYIHVKDLPGKSGPVVSGGPRWPQNVALSGGGWTVLRMDTLIPPSGVEDQFCVDLNDNLYDAGDTVFYYFSAKDGAGRTSYWSEHTGTIFDESSVREYPMEVTCLPANGLNGLTDILFVDVDDGSGTQTYFDNDFKVLGITPDRFDVHSSGFSNGLASRVKDVVQQLIPYYRKIIFSSGSLDFYIIGDGEPSGTGVKQDDFAALSTFLNQHPEDCGVYFTGDNLAYYWNRFCQSNSAYEFRNQFIEFYMVNGDHVAAGEPFAPLGVGQSGSFLDGDTVVVYGSCPTKRELDVITQTGASELAMAYSGNPGHGAILSQETLNADSAYARVILAGFGYDTIHDGWLKNPYGRVAHLHTILGWLGNTLDEPTTAETAPGFEFYLSQNHPNPFNPTTRIRYSLAERTRVSLRVYNVAGQVVATLVNDVKAAGPHAVEWNGRSDSGASVSSGVYFYRIVAGDRTMTKKMVLLK